MRKAIMGVGALLIVVGLVQLILSIVMVGGIAGGIKTQVKGLDPVLEDATGMLTEVADTVDGAVGFLKDMDTTLGDAEKTVGDTLDSTSKSVGNLDTTLAGLGGTVADTTDAVTSVQDAIKEGLEQWKMEITADDLAYWALQVDYAGYDASWFAGWADYLEAEGMVLSVTAEVEVTADDLDSLADQMEYAGYDVTAIRAMATGLRQGGLVWGFNGEDVTGIFTPVAETLGIVSDGLADVSGLLGTTQTSLSDVKGLAAGAISDVRGYLTTAQADVGGLGDSLRNASQDIEAIDVGEMLGGAVDQVVSPLKTYMILSSILFMLAGAGFLLVGLKKAEA